MADPDPQKEVPADPKARFTRFMKVWERGTSASEKSAEIMDALLDAIAHEKEGLIRALDDLGGDVQALQAEVHGLREDLRVIAAHSGETSLKDILGVALGMRRKG